MTDAKERILAAAYALFIGSGFAGVSVNDICGTAGVTKGGFYHHFESKEALFHELLIGSYLPEMTKMLGGFREAPKDPADAIRRVFRINGEAIAGIRSAQNLPETDFGIYYILLEGIKRDPEFAEAVRAYYSDYAKAVTAILERGKSLGIFGGWVDPEAAARGIVARTEGAGIMLLADPSVDPVSYYGGMAEECLSSITRG